MAEAVSKKARDKYFESGGMIVPPEDAEQETIDMAGDRDDDWGDDEKKEPKKEAKKEEKKGNGAADDIEIPSFTERKEAKKDEKAEDKKDEKKDEKADDKEEKKDEKKAKADDDPYAENHRKAMQEERARRKALEKQVKEEGERRAKLEEKFNIFIQAAQQQAQPQPGTQEYAQFQEAQRDAKMQEFDAWKRQQEAVATQRAQMQQFQNAVVSAAKPFIDQTKDYQDAYQHVIGIKGAEMRLAGVPEEEIANQLGVWEANFAAASMRSELNPAEQVYRLAQHLGYKQKNDEKPSKSDAQKKLENIERGQEAAKTLSGGGGGEGLLKALENMSDDEVASLAKNPKLWAKYAGGNSH